MDRPTPQLEPAHSTCMLKVRFSWWCLFLLCLTSGFTGCANRINFVRQDRRPVDPVLKFGMSDEELFSHVNKTSRHLYAWRSSSCEITAYGLLPVPMTAKANLACESPRKFRFLASSIRGPELDLGSNDEEFWFWANDSQNKAVYMASHENLEEAQSKLMIPFQPDWVMEVMGVIPLDQTKYKVKWKEDLKEVSLVTTNQDSEGRSIYRRIVVDTLSGNIKRHEMYGADRQPIAMANLSSYKQVGQSEAQLPHQLILEWPQEGTRFKMKFKDIDVNPSEAQTSVALWQMPQNSRHKIINIGLKQ